MDLIFVPEGHDIVVADHTEAAESDDETTTTVEGHEHDKLQVDRAPYRRTWHF